MNIFHQLSIKTGLDVKTCKRFYYAFLRVVLDELSNSQKIQLPNFGSFYIKERAGKNVGAVMGKQSGIYTYIPPINLLKFRPVIKLKEFVRRIG